MHSDERYDNKGDRHWTVISPFTVNSNYRVQFISRPYTFLCLFLTEIGMCLFLFRKWCFLIGCSTLILKEVITGENNYLLKGDAIKKPIFFISFICAIYAVELVDLILWTAPYLGKVCSVVCFMLKTVPDNTG